MANAPIWKTCQEFDDEFMSLLEQDHGSMAALALILERIEEDSSLREDLMVAPHDYWMHKPAFEVKPLRSAQRKKLNVFILKYKDENDSLCKHRAIFGFCGRGNIFVALTIIPRECDYEREPGFLTRIVERYESVGLFRLP